MNLNYRTVWFVLFCLCCSSFVYGQQNKAVAIPLTDLDAFTDATKNWTIVGDASPDFPGTENITYVKGTGVLVGNSKNNSSSLLTKQQLGDAELELDFLTSRASIGAIYLQGRYGIRLADSWAKLSLTYADMGAIDQRLTGAGQAVEGTIPLMNVSRAPGLWQHLKIRFRAPQFENGKKVANARFEAVYLNGVLIQLQNEITGPTRAAIFKDEQATGPLMLLNDEGITAFRNISIIPLSPLPGFGKALTVPGKKQQRTVNPIILNPGNKPYLLRSFLMFDKKKRTHVISVGDPQMANFSYDLKQGALLQIWRGQFLDVTDMWLERGEPQVAKPLGSVIALSGAPAVAALAGKDAAWPDSIAFDSLQHKGYLLDKARMPTFSYHYNGADIADQLSIINNGESIKRQITIANGNEALFCRLAFAGNIVALKNGLYLIGDKEYYIKVEDGYKPLIRDSKNGKELIVAIGKNTKPLTYTISW